MSSEPAGSTRRSEEPILWIIDSEQWPRACLRAELIERGYDAYGFITVGDALDSLARRTTPKPHAVILELRGQKLSEDLMEALRNLGAPLILLGGNAELNEPLIFHGPWNMILKRPFSLGQVADLVQTAVEKT